MTFSMVLCTDNIVTVRDSVDGINSDEIIYRFLLLTEFSTSNLAPIFLTVRTEWSRRRWWAGWKKAGRDGLQKKWQTIGTGDKKAWNVRFISGGLAPMPQRDSCPCRDGNLTITSTAICVFTRELFITIKIIILYQNSNSLHLQQTYRFYWYWK